MAQRTVSQEWTEMSVWKIVHETALRRFVSASRPCAIGRALTLLVTYKTEYLQEAYISLKPRSVLGITLVQ